MFHYWWKLRDAVRAMFGKDGKATVAQKQTVMDDLKQFCGADRVPLVLDNNGVTDMYQTGKQAGKLEVLFYLQQTMGLSDEQLLAMKKAEENEQNTL